MTIQQTDQEKYSSSYQQYQKTSAGGE